MVVLDGLTTAIPLHHRLLQWNAHLHDRKVDIDEAKNARRWMYELKNKAGAGTTHGFWGCLTGSKTREGGDALSEARQINMYRCQARDGDGKVKSR